MVLRRFTIMAIIMAGLALGRGGTGQRAALAQEPGTPVVLLAGQTCANAAGNDPNVDRSVSTTSCAGWDHVCRPRWQADRRPRPRPRPRNRLLLPRHSGRHGAQ